MTGPQVTRFGGVAFNTDEISSKYVDKLPDGTSRYSVFLKNGIRMQYPEQPANQRASTSGVGEEGRAFQVFRNIDNALILGTKNNVDVIDLEGCQECTVNVMDKYEYGAYDNPKQDIITLLNNERRVSVGNSIFADEFDRVDDLR